MIRLDKYLSNMGKGTRSEVISYIRGGQVSVNQVVIKDNGFKVHESNDLITLNDQPVTFKKEIYLMLNKPQGYVTATEDNYKKTVLDLIEDPYVKKRVAPAGRLDIDTEGFVFLTSDGAMNHKVTGPKSHVRKRYFVKAEHPITPNAIKELEDGVTLDDGYKTKEAKVIPIDELSCYLDLHEGKFHQVKRMFAAVNNKVIYLKRVMIGNLMLDDTLKLGEYRDLTDEERNMICERVESSGD